MDDVWYCFVTYDAVVFCVVLFQIAVEWNEKLFYRVIGQSPDEEYCTEGEFSIQ